jgi:predicted O-linked N-acetylglucosamine transferase (SPINDLY family)
MGATLLGAIGFPQWATSDPDEYVACVLSLLEDEAARITLRRSLRDCMRSSPLLDEAGVTKEFETALWQAWGRLCTTPPLTSVVTAGVAPVH